MNRTITQKNLNEFREYLILEEKSSATLEKYIRDVKAFSAYAGAKNVTKELMLSYKNHLLAQNYAVRSINSMLAGINSFLAFMGWMDCKVKNLRCQRQIYCAAEKELSKVEYMRLLDASRGQERINLVLQTICSTGIRISELKYFTVEAIKKGEINVCSKNKTRTIIVPGKLRKLLLNYSIRKNIKSGQIFVSKNGKALDRSNLWA